MTRTRTDGNVKARGSRDVDDGAVLERRARKSRDGDGSSARGDSARLIRQREARERLVSLLGGSVLTPDLAAVLDAEQAGVSRSASRRAI
jgi:hypothetical protein